MGAQTQAYLEVTGSHRSLKVLTQVDYYLASNSITSSVLGLEDCPSLECTHLASQAVLLVVSVVDDFP